MKILVDGFALALREGTGLSTYSRETVRALTGHGHDVYGLFGMPLVGSDPELMWPTFVQSLMTKGEPDSHEWSRWVFDAVRHAGYWATRRPIRAKRLQQDERIDTSSLQECVPGMKGVFNIPSIFRASQAYSYLLPRPVQIRPPEGADIDVFHRTSPLPLRMEGVANVVTFHDCIPLVLPHSTKVNLRHYRNLMLASLKQADGIFVVSEASRRDMAAYFDIPEEKMHVTYQAVSVPEDVRTADPDWVNCFLRRSFGLEYGRYFLYYGAVEPKKNVQRLIDASFLARRGLPLVVAGKYGWLCEREKRTFDRYNEDYKLQQGENRRLMRWEHLPYRQLMYLLRGARALVFPSLYEGFGLPVLEAMAMGVPVITSNRASLPEVGGDAPLYVDALDAADIARAMERLSEDDALCTTMIEKGLRQARQFSPASHVKRLEEGYGKAMECRNAR